MGHRQTVQTQIRNRRLRRLIRVSTVYLQNVLSNLKKKNMKIPPNNPENRNGRVQLIRLGNSIRLKWVFIPYINKFSFYRLVNLGFRGSGFDISERGSSTAPKSATSIKPLRKYSLKKALSEPRKMTPEVTPLLTERYVDR